MPPPNRPMPPTLLTCALHFPQASPPAPSALDEQRFPASLGHAARVLPAALRLHEEQLLALARVSQPVPRVSQPDEPPPVPVARLQHEEPLLGELRLRVSLPALARVLPPAEPWHEPHLASPSWLRV